MTILDEIIRHKKKEVLEKKNRIPISDLEKSIFFNRNTISFKSVLANTKNPGIIAEFKRKSPSKGIINDKVLPEEVTLGYAQAGAKALSVLTDNEFFGGNTADLIAARKVNNCPILRKDFIIDEYQVIEAKSIGADAILLIASVLDAIEIKAFTSFAHSLKLDVLLELHDAFEIEKICSEIDVVGVNNRNLKNFEVDIQTSLYLSEKIGNSFVKISESGLNNVEDILTLWNNGFKGFLIGETFMKTNNPAESCKKLIDELEKK